MNANIGRQLVLVDGVKKYMIIWKSQILLTDYMKPGI